MTRRNAHPPRPDGSLPVTATRSIPRHELEFSATRSGGAGGQHVNTTSSRVQLKWNLRATAAFSDEERERMAARLAPRIDQNGYVRVTASDTRSQLQNRRLAESRLADLLRRALKVERQRRKTGPSAASKRARLDDKRRQSDKKAARRRPQGND